MPTLRTLLLSLALASVRPPLAACTRVVEEVEDMAKGAGTRGGWPLESAPEDGLRLEGSTCHWWDGSLAAAVGGCEVLILPRSQLAYLRIAGSPGEPPQDVAVRTDAERVRFDRDNVYGLRLGFFDLDATGGPVFVRPAGDEYSSSGRPRKPWSRDADELVKSIVKASNTAPPKELSKPTVEVNFETPCFKWREPKSSATGGRAGTVQVHWNVIAHHVAVAITHRREPVRAPFGDVVAKMVENVTFREPPDASPDMPPPSCYFDESASPDCGLFEPHLFELKLLFKCLGLPTDGFENQKRIANFLRLVVFGLRKPIAPRELAQLATRALLKSGGMIGAASSRVMPGQVAKCFGLDRVDSTVTGRVEAVACHLPMASETGFGMAYSGIMDEASYARRQEVQAAVLQAGGFRAASREEEDALGHPLLVWDKQGERMETVPLPITTIAEIDAPSICARVVVDRLRRMSFMKYDTYAWFGDNSEPVKSLEPTGPDAVKNCIAGANPGVLYDGGSNCRYYIGCFMRLMGSFNQIPGVPADLVALCTLPGRTIVERDPQWMGVDNAYWMSSVGKSSYDLVTGIRSLLPGQSSPKQLAGFRVGDVVRLQMPETGAQRVLYFVASLYHEGDGGLLCLKRGAAQAGCHAPEALQYVPASSWTLQAGTALPILVD